MAYQLLYTDEKGIKQSEEIKAVNNDEAKGEYRQKRSQNPRCREWKLFRTDHRSQPVLLAMNEG